ncbi:MAG TPA: polysaccharide biosynthesis/export family protein, partial [Phycisphaerae bacterium]
MPEDLVPYLEEYRLTKGDFLETRIYELREPRTEERLQVQIDELGMISLPVVGHIQAAGLTAAELEGRIADVLAQKEVLRDAQVTVNPLTRRGASYTIFGFFGAALTANRGGPGTAFIPEPNFHLLEALATSGGLDERVQEVWIYRKKKSEPPASALPRPAANGANPSNRTYGTYSTYSDDARRAGEAPAEAARQEARPPRGLAASQVQDPPGREAGQPTTAP